MDNSTEQSQKSKSVFMTMVGLLGLNAEVKDKASGKNIVLSVSTDEPGRLIGRNGSSLDSVGLLMNRILRKEDNTFPKVIIDVDGYDKKSKDRRNKRRKPARDKAQPEKTLVMAEELEDDAINLYVDDESGKVDPIVTVALGEGDKKDNTRNDNRRRNNRRNDNRRNDNRRNDNRRNDNRRNDRRNDNRNDETRNDTRDKAQSAPVAEKPAAVAEKPAAVAEKPAAVTEKPAAVAEKPAAVATESKTVNAEAKAAPAKQEKNTKPKSSPNRLQMQCRNAAKEVKRWGEDVLLPPLTKEDCEKAIQQFANEADIKAVVDSRSYGDKKRVRLSLNKK